MWSSNFQNNTFIACFIIGFLIAFIGGEDINHESTAETSASRLRWTIFHLGSSWLCFSTWMRICFLHKWRRTPWCASFNAWSAALLKSTCDSFHPNFCSLNQRFHHVKLLATLCANIAMRQEVIGVGRGGRANLSTPALHHQHAIFSIRIFAVSISDFMTWNCWRLCART